MDEIVQIWFAVQNLVHEFEWEVRQCILNNRPDEKAIANLDRAISIRGKCAEKYILMKYEHDYE